MSYQVPEDILAIMQKKFPGVHINNIVNFLFQEILEKTLHDGSCTVREFGKFIAFKTHSTKLDKETVRFKFKISSSLARKIKKDEYLIQNLPVVAQNAFDETHETNVKDKQTQKEYNIVAKQEAERLGKQRTQEKLAADIVMNAIDGNDTDAV